MTEEARQSVTYMPLPDDPDETTLGGVVFKAYEPKELDPSIVAHVGALSRAHANKWFATGEVEQDRHAAWKAVRDAQAALAAHTEEVKRLVEAHKE